MPTLYTPLRWIIGEGMARDLCLTGRIIGAEEAYRLALVSDVVNTDELRPRAMALGRIILEAPLKALQMTKAFLMDHEGRGMEASFLIEHDEVFKNILQNFAAKA